MQKKQLEDEIQMYMGTKNKENDENFVSCKNRERATRNS